MRNILTSLLLVTFLITYIVNVETSSFRKKDSNLISLTLEKVFILV